MITPFPILMDYDNGNNNLNVTTPILNIRLVFGAGDQAQWFRVLTSLPMDCSSISSIHIASLQLSITPALKNPTTSHRYMCRKTNKNKF